LAQYCVLRVISCVAAPCSWTARHRGRDLLTSPMMLPMPLMASMASAATFWMSESVGNFLGRLRGLARQRLDFGGDDGEASARFTGTRAASMVAFSAANWFAPRSN